MDDMVLEYHVWKYGADVDDRPQEHSQEASPTETRPEDSEEAQYRQYEFRVNIVDIYTLENSAVIKPGSAHKSGAAALVAHGYIGATPIHPDYAVSIKTLELYRRLRLRKPSLSVEAFAKVICDYYKVRTGSRGVAPRLTDYSDTLSATVSHNPSGGIRSLPSPAAASRASNSSRARSRWAKCQGIDRMSGMYVQGELVENKYAYSADSASA